MPDDKTQDFMDFALEVIREAGGIAGKYFRTSIVVDEKGDGARFDPVTVADREIEALIRARISTRFPDHSILGEEEGLQEGDSTYRWVIDPVDGTRAFISGSPLWGILLGLMEGNKCLLGLMHQPYINETFTGSSTGAFLERGAERHQIHTRATKELREAILYCTHPSMFDKNDYLRFIGVAERCRMMRYGGDCYSYCMLASGFIDLVIESLGGPYDIIPLIPVIEAAGGIVTDWDGGLANSGGRIIAAATPALHDQALSLLK